MGLTNQQVADVVTQAVTAIEGCFTRQAELQAKHAAQNDADHAAFRNAMVELSKSQVVMQEILARHEKNWGMIWKVVVVPVLLAIIGGIVALVMNGG